MLQNNVLRRTGGSSHWNRLKMLFSTVEPEGIPDEKSNSCPSLRKQVQVTLPSITQCSSRLIFFVCRGQFCRTYVVHTTNEHLRLLSVTKDKFRESSRRASGLHRLLDIGRWLNSCLENSNTTLSNQSPQWMKSEQQVQDLAK